LTAQNLQNVFCRPQLDRKPDFLHRRSDMGRVLSARPSQSLRQRGCALNDGAKFTGRQQPKGAARLVAEPRRAKGIGDGSWRVLQEQRSLHR
jgi:hypothetical protein